MIVNGLALQVWHRELKLRNLLVIVLNDATVFLNGINNLRHSSEPN